MLREPQDPPLPLDGVRVLDLSRLLPGGWCTLMLADLGADVIKVEEPRRGDYIRLSTPRDEHGASALHLCYNRNKRSLALDLKATEGAALLLRLARRADILVESYRPGVLERLGVGYERLSAENPRLVYCALTGYGQSGPLARTPNHDLNLQALGGAVGLTGPAEGAPCPPGVLLADLGSGMWAAYAALAALRQAERTSRGQFIDIAMLDTVVGFLGIHGQSFLSCATPGGRENTRHNGRRPSYRVYPTADGRQIAIACSEPKFWENLCRLIGREEFRGDGAARGARRKEVIAALNEAFRQRTLAEWVALFEGEEVCFSPVLEMNEVYDHPQVRARGMVGAYPHPAGGTYPSARLPPVFSEAGPLKRRPAPRLGEHSREVLGEFGVAPAEIDALFEKGISHAGRDPEGETISD